MEQVGVKNSLVRENSLGNEVNQMSNNVPLANYSKSGRTKNGLVNGVADEKCNSSNNPTTALKTNQDTNKSIEDISQDKCSQHVPQNCISNTALSEQSSPTNLSNSSDTSPEPIQNDMNCTNSKTKHKKKTKCGDELSEDDLHIDSESIGDNRVCEEELSKQTVVNSNNLVNCISEMAESDKDLVVEMNKLQLENPNVECTTPVTDTVLIDKVEVTEDVPDACEIVYVQYESELQMPLIMKIIQKDLSEPYSIYTYRYFIHNWPKLCFLAMCEDKCVGAIVCKLDYHRKSTIRGYIAMLAVDQQYRKRKIGSTLVKRAIREMIVGNADEVVLETEVTNKPALRLYELLGFVRDKRLFRYYLNGVDALRLKLWLR